MKEVGDLFMKKTYGFLQGLIAVSLCASITPFMLTVYKNFKSIARKIGLPDTRFHDLRHTYAVISLESGSDVKTLQEFMGHSKATTTLDIYSHVSRTMKLRAADNQTKYIESIM